MHTSLDSNSPRFGTAWRAVAALLLLFGLSGCTEQQKQGDSSSFLIVLSLTAAPGAEPTALGTVLASDVRTHGTAYSDPAIASLQLALKDPGTPTSPSSPTANNFVTVKRYRVRYVRNDGGPVPEAFEGGATFTVTDAVTSSGPLVLVRAQAKNLSPLVQLAGQGGAAFLPMVAEVTFEGTDQAGRAVSVTGYITINFADWADPGSDPTPGAASFTITPATGLRANQVADFNGSGSTASAGRQIVAWAWSFGDGSTGSGAQTSYVYPAPGTYTVRLTVTDSAGASYFVERTITVVP